MKKLVLFRHIAFLILITIIAVPSFGQQAVQMPFSSETGLNTPAPNPMPMTDPSLQNATGHSYWGFDLGLTYSWYSGANNFFWPVRDNINDISTPLLFNSLGSGLGGIFGIKAGFPLSHSLELEGKLRYVTNYSSETENEPLPVFESNQQLSVNNTYSALLSNLDLAAILHFALSDQWYAAGGLSFSALLSNRFSASQTVPTTYIDDAGNTTAISSETVPSGSQSAFTTSRADALLGAGTIIPMSSDKWELDAELLLSVPLTSWLTSGTQTAYNADADFYTARDQSFGENVTYAHPTFPNLWYASLTIGIRFPFGGNSSSSAAMEPSSSTETQESPSTVELKGRVTDDKTGNPVPSNLTVVDLTNNQVVANDHTDDDGRYSVRVKAPGKYSVTADADGYLFGTAYFEVDDQGRILSRHPDIKLASTSGGRVRLLVFFDFNSSSLKQESYPELNRAVRLMKAVPTMNVEIAGYTDNIGADDVNLRLSQQRANAVRTYLIQNGVDGSRVTAKGYGKDSPIADNSTDDGRAENRRVEFVVLSR